MNSEKKSALIASLLLILLIALVFLPTLGFDFAFDDTARIKDEPLVSGSLAFTNALSIIFSTATFPGDLYRPLTTLAYHIEFRIFGASASGFHFMNLLLHCFSCMLGMLLLIRYGCSLALALGSTAIFALHPINVESVASIAGQAELLSACFGLTGLLLISGQAPRVITLIAASLCFSASAFAKESGLIFPLLGIIVPLIRERSFRIQTTLYAVSILPWALYLLGRANALGSKFLIERPSVFLSENPLLDLRVGSLERILPSFEVLGDYIRLILLPIHFSVDYSRGFETFWTRVYSFDGILSAFLSLGLVLWAFRTRNISFQIGVAWFFLSFLATCNLFFPIGTIMAERLAYTPSFGFSLALASLIQTAIPGRRFAIALFSVALILAARSSFRIPLWQSDRVLLLELAQIAPKSPKAHYITGKEYLVIHKDFEKADFYLRQALALDPTRFGPMRELANLALQRKEYGRAEYWIRKALEIVPGDQELNFLLNQLTTLKKAPEGN